MKLKKIAALALAGVMAVSMLAGCKFDTANNGAASSEQTATATGYSAMLAAELKDTAAKKYVTFQDNADDQAALEDMLGNFTNGQIIGYGWTAGTGVDASSAVTGTVLTDLKKAAGIDYFGLLEIGATDKMLGTWKVAKVYAANGTVDTSKVIKAVANLIGDEDLADELVEKGTTNAQDAKYSYVVSASVVNVKGTQNLQRNDSTTVVLVTVTRTGVAD